MKRPHVYLLFSVLTLVLAGIIMRPRLHSAPPGAQIFGEWGCGTCHGVDQRGTATGPPLQDLAQHWQRKELQQYLQHPATIRAHDTRLQALAQRYQPIIMPAAEDLRPEQISALADYLLQH